LVAVSLVSVLGQPALLFLDNEAEHHGGKGQEEQSWSPYGSQKWETEQQGRETALKDIPAVPASSR
jgi:hypothetical protein